MTLTCLKNQTVLFTELPHTTSGFCNSALLALLWRRTSVVSGGKSLQEPSQAYGREVRRPEALTGHLPAPGALVVQ